MPSCVQTFLTLDILVVDSCALSYQSFNHSFALLQPPIKAAKTYFKSTQGKNESERESAGIMTELFQLRINAGHSFSIIIVNYDTSRQFSSFHTLLGVF